MSRKQRYRVIGIPQLIHQRGHNGDRICASDNEVRHLHACLAESASDFGVEVHAYAFGAHHVHLLATPGVEDGVALMMQSMGRRYVPWYNARHGRTGTLWGGRYRACVVEPGPALLDCSHYVEGQARGEGALGGPCSSARANAHGRNDALIVAHDVYHRLGADRAARAVRYRQAGGLTDARIAEIDAALEGCNALGSDGFKDILEARLERAVRPGKPGRPARCAPLAAGARPWRAADPDGKGYGAT